MSVDFQISLPPWPMARVLKEASAHWNLLHPNNLADPEKSDWPLLCNVVHSFLRHQQTQYEQGGSRRWGKAVVDGCTSHVGWENAVFPGLKELG